MVRMLATSKTVFSALVLMLLFCGSNLHAVSVGDPEIKTDDTYFPGELAMSTLPRILTHAYGITRGAVGTVSERDRLIKLFLWRSEHYTHLLSPEVYTYPSLTPNPNSPDTLMTEYDSLRGMFSYGWGVCGTNHAQMRAISEEAGFAHRRRQLAGDTGQEMYVNGGWRYVNTDQYTLHFLSNSASADFASMDQVIGVAHHYIEWNPDLGGGTFLPQAPTHGSYATVTGSVVSSIPLRSQQWRNYYGYPPFSPVWTTTPQNNYKMYAEGYNATPIVFRLKRGETFTRWLKPTGIVTDLGLAGRCWWGWNSSGNPHADYSFIQNAPARDQLVSGPEESQKGGGTDHGNVCYDWQPSLANSEHLDGLADQTGTFAVGGSPMLKATTAATMVFEFFSPYTICGRPTGTTGGNLDPAKPNCFDGAILTTTSTGTITADISTDAGASWTSVPFTAAMDFTDKVKARNHYLLRLNFSANAGLNTLRLRTIGMLSQAVYPNLKNGNTTITYQAGNQGGLDLSPNMWTSAAANSTTGYVQKVADSGNLTGDYYGSVATAGYIATNNSPISLTYKITMPPSLASAGATFKQIFAAEDNQVRVTPFAGTYGQIDVSTSATGPWTQIGRYDIPMDNELSHFWTYGRSADGSNLGGTTYYVRFSAWNGGSGTQYMRQLKLYATYNLPAPGTSMDVTYYWNNGTPQTSPTHTIPSGTTSTSWTVNSTGLTAQNKVVFSVPSGGVAPPVITTQPTNQSVTAPATATFTVVASGATSYQWKRGGAPIGGATSASYTTGPTTVAGDNGAQFTVDVTNAGGTVTSNIATLTVVAAGSPVITTQPANQTVTEPATATFSVIATGATSYQWKRGGAPIGGATSASYTTGVTTVAGDNGAQFTVDVTNASGTVTSNIATLTVNAVAGPPVTVSFQDGLASYTGTIDNYLDAFNPTTNYGTTQRVDVNWYDPGTGVTETTLGLLKFDLSSIPAGATVTSASIDLWLIRTNSISGSDTLVMDKVTGNWDETTTYSSGVPTSVASGIATPSLAAVPNGSPLSPSYQYTITGLDALVQGWVTTASSNKGVIFSFASNANFRFSSREGTTASERPMLTVTYSTGGSAPVITTQPANQTVTAPAAATFSVVATGALSYQWQLGGVDIAGATSASYTINPTNTGMSGGVYRVRVTNASGTTTSNNATLTVNAAATPPVITTQPANQTVTAPAAATFSVVATGALSYQWQLGGVDIAGATSASYTINPTNTGMSGGVYRVRVTNASGTTTSNNATLTVNAAATPPVITTQPASQTVTAPASVTFSVVATGALSYQWQLATVDIAGATSASYTINPTNTGMTGGVYRVRVTNASGTTTSNNATLTVNASGNPITPSISTVTFTATAGSTTPQSQGITLTNTSGGSITVTPTSSQTWLTTSGALTIGAGANGTLTVTVNPTGLSGSNTATLTLANSTGGTQTLTINLNITAVAGNPITSSVSTVTLGAPTGSTTAVTTTISLTNTSGGSITVTPATSALWLATGGAVTIPAGATVTLSITGTPTGLSGVNTANLTLTNSTGGTQTIPVNFTIGATAIRKKRSCEISNTANPDAYMWAFGFAALAGMMLFVRRRTA